MSFEDSSEEEIRQSGVGILEFSPLKAGQDVTPVNLEFGHALHNHHDKERKRSSGFSTLTGITIFNTCIMSTLK